MGTRARGNESRIWSFPLGVWWPRVRGWNESGEKGRVSGRREGESVHEGPILGARHAIGGWTEGKKLQKKWSTEDEDGR